MPDINLIIDFLKLYFSRVFKELPILSPESEMAARAALVVWKYQKKKYFKFHEALMKTRGPLSEQTIFRIAQKIKIDVSQVRNEMHSVKIDNILLKNQKIHDKYFH